MPTASREPYAPIKLSLRENLKLELAASREPAALGWYICAILWAVKYGTDGVVYDSAVDKIAPGISGRTARRAVDALGACGLLDPDPAGTFIHDFLDHQRSAEQVAASREASRVRQADWRASQGSSHNGSHGGGHA